MLIAVQGPLRGLSFTLDSDEISIGRESSNEIEIADLLISRRQCVVRCVGGLWQLVDLSSANGTCLNGRRIDSSALAGGDRIEIGNTVLVFTAGGEAADLVELDDGQAPLRDTIVIQAPLEADPSQRTANWGRAERENALQALLSIGSALGNWKTRADLQEALLKAVLDGIPADRVAVVLLRENSLNEVRESFAYSRHRDQSGAQTGSTIPVSRTMIKRVVELRSALLEVVNPANIPDSIESLRHAGVTSVLIAPLAVPTGVIGALYLDTTAAPPLCEEHLQLVAAIAGMVAQTLDTSWRIELLQEENGRILEGLRSQSQMAGDSPAMQAVYRVIGRVATADTTVLLLGETGAGKELAARAIHAASRRSQQPWVAVNCAALHEGVLESELFGHERGAFTGAVAMKRGRLELADGGTLFLDEIGELSSNAQAKLLRVLQERTFERVGGTRTLTTDIRLIAATNCDLQQAVTEGRFRKDLYYRLNVVTLRMPALRDRGDDVMLLASFFLARFAHAAHRRIDTFSDEARHAICAYPWPGNVRELQNAIERAAVLGDSSRIEVEDLPEEVTMHWAARSEVSDGSFSAGVREAKRQILQEALERAGGNFTEAARVLRVNVKYLHRLLRNFDLKAPNS